MLKYYPEEWAKFKKYIKAYEQKFNRNWQGYYNFDKLENVLETKYEVRM